MNKRGPRHDDLLPSAPLAFAYPLQVPGPDLNDAVLVAELPPAYALAVLRAYRLVLTYATRESVDALDPAALEAWEQVILGNADVWEPGVWSALTVIMSELRGPDPVDQHWIALACMTLMEWALKHGARNAAVCIAEAAALVVPANARYAYVVGRMYRERGRLREAELWLERSRRVAVWHADREAISVALNSLGNLAQLRGRYAEAEELLHSALRVAKRARLRERQAAVYHDLLVVAVYTGKLAKGVDYARAAFGAYAPDHPNLLKLAHDVAFLWSEHGQHARALHIFSALLPHFTEPEARLRVLGYGARSAGAVLDQETYSRYSTEAWAIIDSGSVDHLRSAAALELGVGALSLGLEDDARRALDAALESAADAGDNEVIVKASEALERLRRGESSMFVHRPGTGRARRPEDDFVGQLVLTIGRYRPAADNETSGRPT